MLEKYNETLDKVNNTIKKGFDSEAVYNVKHLKTKIRSYEGKVNTVNLCICLSMILIELVLEWVKTIILKCFFRRM